MREGFQGWRYGGEELGSGKQDCQQVAPVLSQPSYCWTEVGVPVSKQGERVVEQAEEDFRGGGGRQGGEEGVARSLDGKPPELNTAREPLTLVPSSRVFPVLTLRVLQHHRCQGGRVVEPNLVTNCICQVARLLVQICELSSPLPGQNDLVIVPELVPHES